MLHIQMFVHISGHRGERNHPMHARKSYKSYIYGKHGVYTHWMVPQQSVSETVHRRLSLAFS